MSEQLKRRKIIPKDEYLQQKAASGKWIHDQRVYQFTCEFPQRNRDGTRYLSDEAHGMLESIQKFDPALYNLIRDEYTTNYERVQQLRDYEATIERAREDEEYERQALEREARRAESDRRAADFERTVRKTPALRGRNVIGSQIKARRLSEGMIFNQELYDMDEMERVLMNPNSRPHNEAADKYWS